MRLVENRLYQCWAHIKQRCFNPNDPLYSYYGGRGIIMCDEWKMSYHKFETWALTNGYTDTLTIERINVNGNYCPDNCKWIPKSEQSKNRRNCVMIEGITLKEYCKQHDLNYSTVNNRMGIGWTLEEAISKPTKTGFNSKKSSNKIRGIIIDGSPLMIYCKEHNLDFFTIYRRLSRGMNIDKALINVPPYKEVNQYYAKKAER